MASVGHFYGDPDAAYIDPEERFCITIGCGIIKYNLCEPFEGYMYNCEPFVMILFAFVTDLPGLHTRP